MTAETRSSDENLMNKSYRGEPRQGSGQLKPLDHVYCKQTILGNKIN